MYMMFLVCTLVLPGTLHGCFGRGYGSSHLPGHMLSQFPVYLIFLLYSPSLDSHPKMNVS